MKSSDMRTAQKIISAYGPDSTGGTRLISLVRPFSIAEGPGEASYAPGAETVLAS